MSTGFAIPPAGHAIRDIIDKTAKMVGGGTYSEKKIKEGFAKKNPNSNKFAFFEEDNIYHQYYKLRLYCEREKVSVSRIIFVFIRLDLKSSLSLLLFVYLLDLNYKQSISLLYLTV